MGCTSCGAAPCRCSRPGTCAGCGTLPCCCGSLAGGSCCGPNVPASPTPYYLCAPNAAQPHQQRIVLQQFFTTISVSNSWNIPACGEEAILTVVGLKSAPLGASIWNSEFGYFEITAFDAGTGQLTILNNCAEGNAAPGTNVPACTEFAVVAPPCECPDESQICVAVDFTAPDVDDCIDITLTTSQGITAGDTIQIGSGFYFVSEVKPNDIITICNQGDGITPGTAVIALDSQGNYQYCITIVSVNPCDRPAQIEGTVLICDGSGQTVPLDAQNSCWVVTALDSDGGDIAAFRPLGACPEDCTTTTAVWTLVSGDPTYINMPVVSTAGFEVGDVLDILGGSGYRFTITSIPNATNLNFTVSPTPDDVVFPSGSVICIQSCCDELFSIIRDSEVFADDATANQANLDTVTPNLVTPSATIVVTTGKEAALLITSYFATYTGSLHDCNAHRGAVSFRMSNEVNGGGTVLLAQKDTPYFTFDDTARALTDNMEVVTHTLLSPLTTYTIELTSIIQWTGAATAGITSPIIDVAISASLIQA